LKKIEHLRRAEILSTLRPAAPKFDAPEKSKTRANSGEEGEKLSDRPRAEPGEMEVMNGKTLGLHKLGSLPPAERWAEGRGV
jgi:hypothetical protein